jgi:KDO2-lipid IV(A) lauroyltransferase
MDAQSADGGAMMANGGEPERKKKNPHHSSAITHPSALGLPLEAQVKEVFQRSGANLLSGFTFARMSPETAEKHIVFEGLDLLKSSLEEGKGVIILLAHMGPWEGLNHLPRVAKKVGIEAPFGALYRPLNNNYLDEWFKGVREIQGTRLFSHRDGFHKPAEFIKSGGMLGILSDQKLKRGELVPFFGVPAKTSPIPGLMQRRSHSPVLRASISTIDQARWQIQLDTVQYPKDPTMRQRETEARLTNKGLESMLSQSILDGFWFHKRYSNSQYSDASR